MHVSIYVYCIIVIACRFIAESALDSSSLSHKQTQGIASRSLRGFIFYYHYTILSILYHNGTGITLVIRQ